MNPFEVYSWQPPGWPEPHPCVIVSAVDRAGKKPDVEVVICSTKKAGRAAEPHEIILDEADGLDWPILCKCDLIHTVSRDEVKGLRGQVSPLRRQQIIRKITAAHGWGETLAG